MVPLSLNANFWIATSLLISIQCGCGANSSSPSKDELAAILGKLDESVVVLGGKTIPLEVSYRAEQDEGRQPSLAGGRLWIVYSGSELPCPHARDSTAVVAMINELEPKIRVELDAFPARVAYDIAAELQISPQSIQMPKTGDLLTAKGRMCEWYVNEKQIRVRDFPTTDGWLSVVEVFQEPIK